MQTEMKTGMFFNHGPSFANEYDPTNVEFFNIDGTDFIKIHVDDKTIPVYEATEEYQEKYAVQWNAYKNGGDPFEGQTMLDSVGWIPSSAASAFKSNNVFTVEQLAYADESQLRNVKFPGVLAMRSKAQEYARNMQAQAGTLELKAENDSLKERMAKMEAFIEAMGKKETKK